MPLISGRLLYFERNLLLQVSKYSSHSIKQTPAEYCMELVKKLDYENFLCTLLYPSEVRATGFAVHAFNVEVAQVRDQVHDYNLGEMRLKFWMDALRDTYDGNPPRNPVMLELHRVLQKHHLSKRYFKRLINVRLEKLRDCSFTTLHEIENYAEYSTSSIYYLLLEAQNITNIHVDHVASHIGKAHGIINLLRSVPYNAKQRINMLPQNILMKYGVSTEAVLQGQSSEGLQNVIYEVASHGKQHLDTAINLKTKMDMKGSTIFLPRIIIEKYLKELRNVNFNVFHPKLQQRNNLLPVRLLWHKCVDSNYS